MKKKIFFLKNIFEIGYLNKCIKAFSVVNLDELALRTRNSLQQQKFPTCPSCLSLRVKNIHSYYLIGITKTLSFSSHLLYKRLDTH